MKQIILLFFLISNICFAQQTSQGELSRPIIGEGTLLSHQGSLLRGAYWSTDWDGQLPLREDLERIKHLGLNSLHLYGELFDSHYSPGTFVDEIDTLIQWCGELDIYCILTVGCGNSNGQFDRDFTRDFWTIYAPRYADLPWVIYEIQNEPEMWEAPYGEETLAMEQESYELIRSLAPDTPVLFFSYAELSSAHEMVRDMSLLQVDWSNAVVAWHGYDDTLTHSVLEDMKTQGINSICTELPMLGHERANVELIEICESQEISWLAFLNLNHLREDWRFKAPIVQAGIRWSPDFNRFPRRYDGFQLPVNLALDKIVSSSTVEDEHLNPAMINDGRFQNSRWASDNSRDQWVEIDLGSPFEVERMMIYWEWAYAEQYSIEGSVEGDDWETLLEVSHSDGILDTLYLNGLVRYLRIRMTEGPSPWGYSIYEWEIY